MTDEAQGNIVQNEAHEVVGWEALGLPSILVVLLFTWLLRRPLDGDPALYSYIGWRLAQGDRLYLDVWDVKPPLFPWLFGFGFMLFGKHEWVGGVLEMGAVLATGVGVYRLAHHYAGRAAGRLASVAMIVALWGLSFAGYGQQAEVFATPLIVWAVLWGVTSPDSRAKTIAAGVCLMAAALIKTPFILFVVPWVMAMGRRPSSLWAAVGAAIPLGATLTYLSAVGALAEARYTLLKFGQVFVAERRLPWDELFAAFPMISGGLWLIVALTALGIVVAFVDRRLGVIAVALTVAIFITIYQSTYWLYHWVPIQAFALVALAVWLPSKTPALDRVRSPLWFALLAAILLTPLQPKLIAEAGWFIRRLQPQVEEEYLATIPSFYGYPPISQREMRAIARRVAAESGSGDTVWMPLCAPTIAFLANRREPVRFLYYDGVFVKAPRQQEWQREYFDAVLRARPKFIVLARQAQGRDLKRFVEQNPAASQMLYADYELVETYQAPEGESPAVELLRRKTP